MSYISIQFLTSWNESLDDIPLGLWFRTVQYLLGVQEDHVGQGDRQDLRHLHFPEEKSIIKDLYWEKVHIQSALFKRRSVEGIMIVLLDTVFKYECHYLTEKSLHWGVLGVLDIWWVCLYTYHRTLSTRASIHPWWTLKPSNRRKQVYKWQVFVHIWEAYMSKWGYFDRENRYLYKPEGQLVQLFLGVQSHLSDPVAPQALAHQ